MEKTNIVTRVRHRRRGTERHNCVNKYSKAKNRIILPDIPTSDASKFRLVFFWNKKDFDLKQKYELEWRISSIFNVTRRDGRYEYFNPDTKAEALFYFYKATQLQEVGLVFELSLPCPRYFALETCTIPIALAREFKLRIEILGNDEIKINAVEDLIKCWQEQNDQAGSAKEGQRPYMLRSRLEEIWEYLILYRRLKRRYDAEKLSYGPINLVKDSVTGEVYSICDWDLSRPSVFPNVDLLKIYNVPEWNGRNKIINLAEFLRNQEKDRRWLKRTIEIMDHYVTKSDIDRSELLAYLESLSEYLRDGYEKVSFEDVEDI